MRPAMRRLWRQGLTGLLLSLFVGCAHGRIPNTNIPDSEENREIYGLVEKYRKSLEALDAAAVLALASPRFYENNGNTDPSDDYDFAGLQANLKQDFARTNRLFANFRVDAIEVHQDTAWAEVYFQVRAHNRYPTGEKWDTVRDRTRLRFVRDTPGGPWKVIAGL